MDVRTPVEPVMVPEPCRVTLATVLLKVTTSKVPVLLTVRPPTLVSTLFAPRASVPPLTVVPPVYVLAPLRVSVPAPIFVRPPETFAVARTGVVIGAIDPPPPLRVMVGASPEAYVPGFVMTIPVTLPVMVSMTA